MVGLPPRLSTALATTSERVPSEVTLQWLAMELQTVCCVIGAEASVYMLMGEKTAYVGLTAQPPRRLREHHVDHPAPPPRTPQA